MLWLNKQRLERHQFLLLLHIATIILTFALAENILFQLWWEASCLEELKWSDRRQCTILIAVFLSLSVFLCRCNAIVVQAACLRPPDNQNHPQACWWFWDLIEDRTGFQGRAAYAWRTNGKCSVILYYRVVGEVWRSQSWEEEAR